MRLLLSPPSAFRTPILKATLTPRLSTTPAPDKPWHDPAVDLADRFWHYCRQTNFYEIALQRMCSPALPPRLRARVKQSLARALPADTKLGATARRLYHRLRH